MDISFTRLDLLLGQATTNLERLRVEPDPEATLELSQSLRRVLLDSPRHFRWHSRGDGRPTIDMTWIAAGFTAGVAHWSIDQKSEAASVLLTGLDFSEDLAALQLLFCALPGALPEHAADGILQNSRPLIANLFAQPELLSNPAFISSTSALAISFFGTMGVSLRQESWTH